MADSPVSSDLSDPPTPESEGDGEERLSTAVPSSRPSVDITNTEQDQLPPPSKRRKTGASTLATSFERAPSSQAPDDADDTLSVSSDDFSSAPGSPSHDEYALRDEAQTVCLWRDCDFGTATNNDDLVKHVQATHCATGGPKKTKYVCEWGECQRKTSNHPSGYALKAHMRSHTKEKPYYCALPECDKAFTRSDALAKHMRTVHEPELVKGGANANDPTPPGKKSIKLKLTNGSSTSTSTPPTNKPMNPLEAAQAQPPPTHDEDGNPVEPSYPNDNITYLPAHHPLTGQPGFMITYPPDIHFSAWESSIAADQLMRLLRRQLDWAQKEQTELKAGVEELEKARREEWQLKEILLDGVMEAELERGEKEGLLANVNAKVKQQMEADGAVGKGLKWSGGTPVWRGEKRTRHQSNNDAAADEEMPDATPDQQRTPSPTAGGGFDGDQDPYDNYLAQRMAEYEERERLRSLHNTPQKQQQEREADAVGVLVGMSGK